MTSRQSLTVVVLGALLATSAPADDPKAPRLDRHGDPLPEHAIARIGTVRLRHGGPITALAFSPDGKTLASAGADRTVSLWNLSDGKERLRIAIDSAKLRDLTFQRDGKVLLGWFPDGPVCRWDTETGKKLPPFPDWPSVAHVAALSADGSTVVSLHAPPPKDKKQPRPAGHLRIWDTISGKLVRYFKTSPSGISLLALSANGKALAASTSLQEQDDPRNKAINRIVSLAFVWDVATGEKILESKGPDYPSTLGFAMGNRLFFALGMEARFWDLKAGKEVPSALKEKWPGDGYVSSDGETLFTAGSSSRLWDLSKAELHKEVQGLTGIHSAAAFSADKRVLATGDYEGIVRLWGLTDLKEHVLASTSQTGIVRCRILKNGENLLVQFGACHLFAHDVSTGRELKHFYPKTTQPILDVAADGSTAAIRGNNWDPVQLIDPETGKVIHSLEHKLTNFKAPLYTDQCKILSDHKILSVRVFTLGGAGGANNFALINDIRNGKELRSWGPFGTRPVSAPLAVSPDQKTIAFPVANWNGDRMEFYIWEVESGKQLFKDEEQKLLGSRVEFTPNSKYFSVWHGRNVYFTSPDSESRNLCLWEIPTRQLAHTIKLRTGQLEITTFRRDGRLVALGQSDGDIVLWDIVTSSERRRLKGHRGPIHSLAFTDDGRKLISGGSDSSALIWDVKDLLTPPKPTGLALTTKQLESVWVDLAGEDAQKGFRAVTTLAGAPEQAIPFLQERLKPVVALPAEQIQKLLADLNAQRFATRQRAREDLVTQGRAVVPALKKALEGEPPLEARRRIEELLTELKDHRPANALRLSRALLSLEYIGDPAARKLLQTLADGASGAWLTEQAKAALERMIAE